MSDYLLSICIPTYNGKQKLEYTVNELLNNIDADIVQICISDNGSVDGSDEYLKNVAKNNSNVKYYHYEKNMGFAKNCENVLYLGDGKYCWLLGNDDIPIFDNYQKLIKFLSSTNDLDLIILNSSCKSRSYLSFPSAYIDGVHDFFCNYVCLASWISTLVFSKNAINKINFFNTENAFPHLIWIANYMNVNDTKVFFYNEESVTQSIVDSCTYNENSIKIFTTDFIDVLNICNIHDFNIFKTYINLLCSVFLSFESLLGFRAKGGLSLRKYKENISAIKLLNKKNKINMFLVCLIPRKI